MTLTSVLVVRSRFRRHCIFWVKARLERTALESPFLVFDVVGALLFGGVGALFDSLPQGVSGRLPGLVRKDVLVELA